MEKQKLKPVTFTTGKYIYNSNNDLQQKLLLRALTVTQNPKQLKEMIGAKTVADVYRTFDKLALRKEYHAALSRLGIDFDYIVGGIKGIADCGRKDGDRLKAFMALLGSLGLTDYKDAPPPTDGWEEILRNASSKSLESPKEDKNEEEDDYKVNVPEMPESVRKMKEDEESIGKSLYE